MPDHPLATKTRCACPNVSPVIKHTHQYTSLDEFSTSTHAHTGELAKEGGFMAHILYELQQWKAT